MKIKRRRVRRGRVEIIPLIDTIVILLIFYMSFSRVAEMNRESKVDLPPTVSGDEIRSETDKVTVNMLSGDDIRVAGRTYTVADLIQFLRKQKADNPKISIILRGDRKMTYKDLSDLMGACAKAGIADVTFATIEK
jgi:biopolymer transport protein ExbD